jgi:hypothetical protein
MPSADDDWENEQLKPLNLIDLAGKWADGLKVLGTGNGAGLLAAGAALHNFASSDGALVWIKVAGVAFFVGVFAFAIAFMLIHGAVFNFDEMLHATRRKDSASAARHSKNSSISMVAANRFAIAATASFFCGMAAGLIAFLKA